jgi:hypothetical protein
MIDSSKLDCALQKLTRTLRVLCFAAWGATVVAFIDAAVAVDNGSPLVVVLDVVLFFVAAFQWANYLAACSTRTTLKIVRESLESKPS